MERLTVREARVSGLPGVCCTHFTGPECQILGGCCAEGCPWEDAAWERLAAYEDTGLTPEEVTSLQVSNQELKKEALPILQAKVQDRLVVLPVKIGDKIFRLFNGKIEDLLVSNVIYRAIGGDASRILVECIPFHRIYWREDFGKTVFLSKEKAEAALKEREG